jgi:hypothetical protein
MPSKNTISGKAKTGQHNVYRPSPADAINSPGQQDEHPRLFDRKDLPLGDHLTTLTGAVCLFSVARYSIRGGGGAGVADPAAWPDAGSPFSDAVMKDGLMFGWTIHNWKRPRVNIGTVRAYYNAKHVRGCDCLRRRLRAYMPEWPTGRWRDLPALLSL